MTSTYLGSSKTNKDGISTLKYHSSNRGIINIVAIAKGNISTPCKILDYDIEIVKNISINDDGVLLIETISSDLINGDNFIADIIIDDGIFYLTEGNTDVYGTTISKIDDNNGILIIRTINDILDWL